MAGATSTAWGACSTRCWPGRHRSRARPHRRSSASASPNRYPCSVRHGRAVGAGAGGARREYAASDGAIPIGRAHDRRREVDRGVALRQYERRSGERILHRRHCRGDHQRVEQDSVTAGRVAHVVVRLQGQEQGHRRDRGGAQGGHGTGRERAQGRQQASGDGPTGQRR